MAKKEEQDEAYDSQEEGQDGTSKREYPNLYDAPAKRPKRANVDVHDPMFLWILLLMVAVALRILLTTTKYIIAGTQLSNIAGIYSNFLLQFPGIAILPLIIGAIIGSEVGERSNTLASALRSGLTNGVYCAIIYVVTIVIINIILNYAAPQFSTIYVTVLNQIVLPILVFILTLEVFAALSYSRKVDS